MMIGSLAPRIRRLEDRHGDSDARHRQVAADAATFVSRMGKLAAGLDDADRGADSATRACWSRAQNVAWAMRFAPDRVAPLLQEHLA